MKINPVILSGGSGTRLWPLSRTLNPKQFLTFFGKNSLFANTALRVKGFCDPIVICNQEHRFIAASEMQKIGKTAKSIILEPQGRNTAPAIAVAAFNVIENNPEDDIMLVMPSDHIIANEEEFLRVVKSAAKITKDHLVTFGITADHANTGYGYIKKSQKIATTDDSFLVEKFVEKPDQETAEKFVASGDYFFNSGIFLFKASKYLQELQKLAPEIYQNAQKSYQNAQKDLDFTRLDEEYFAKCPDISIDYAVMEKLANQDKIAVLELNAGWDDVGNFASIAKNTDKDQNGNNIIGDIELFDTKNCYINSQSGLTAAVGVENLVIINSKDVTLVANKNNAQDIKKLYQKIKEKSRPEISSHSKVLRPWGSFETMDEESGFKVKRITVKPGSALSLQMHHKRAEHWIVVNGTAVVTCEERVFELKKGESTFIPLGKKHRLENKTNELLEIVEVQTGSYLGEDDIVRFQDNYGR